MIFIFFFVIVCVVDVTIADTCQYIQAQAGDGCWSLAQRCGISQADLETYNPESDFCNTIQTNQYVCCSAGSLPDFSPKPYSNGTCYTYIVQENDFCSTIETANFMQDGTIPLYNNQTWGWAGCSLLQIGQRICLSTGDPPFPAELANALCGPQVPGTIQPAGMPPSNWTNLNPCPLNACCDIWGQCGITNDFCVDDPADTLAPGTAQPNTNGCISNCGADIQNDQVPPDQIRRVGYFESWNLQRACMHMDISKFQDDTYYTHIHWAFANVTTDWAVDISGAQDQFNGLLNLTGKKRILSFGGWGFSTSLDTFTIFREAVKDGNRQIWAQNVVNFITTNNLDGVDFDYEYPGAQDIPGIPPDSVDSPQNYLEFLKLVRAQLPSDKTLSIAAPASYWYLSLFPITEMADVVDYIIYMTYDLHGQWDYNKTSADPGCPNGGCLRSQVNKTETEYALSMITKAGVPANKVVVGLALYGRSFEMVDPNCTGPECHFTGPLSGAEAGPCTGTAGYLSNYEIFQILAEAQNPDLYGNMTVTQDSSDEAGDILIYDTSNWVSWLSPSSYEARRSWTDGLNFGGTSDWAVDLNQTFSNNGTGSEESSGYDDNSDFALCDYTLIFNSLGDLSAASGGLRSDCIAAYTMQVLIDMLNTAYANYTDVNNGYDDMFGYYVTYIEDLVPEILKAGFMFNITDNQNWDTIGFLPDLGYGMNYFNCVLPPSDGRTIPCSQTNTSDGYEFSMRNGNTMLVLIDPDGYNAGLAQAGLSPDWVVFGDFQLESDIVSAHGGQKRFYNFTDFPVKNGSMVVTNPKDIVTQALPSIPALNTSMQATLLDMKLGQWTNGSLTDPAQAYSTAVFMLMQAVDDMAQAKQLGQEEEQQEEEEAKRKKNFLLMIISVILMFVPVVGEEVAAAAGFADLARAIALTGELGNGILAVYNTVEDPSSAVMNVLGMLLGVGSIAKATRDGEGISSVAKIRKEMTADDIASFGKIFSNNDDKLQSIMKVCRLS